jgi:hypothetical protein
LGIDFESVAKLWLHDKKLKAINICTITALWAIWKFRNELCFQDTSWIGGGVRLRRIADMLQDWTLLTKEEEAKKLVAWAGEMERKSVMLPQQTWEEVSMTKFGKYRKTRPSGFPFHTVRF